MQFPGQLPLQLFCSYICQKSSNKPQKTFDKNPTKTLQKFGGTKTFIYF
jgi:hypothetical protein